MTWKGTVKDGKIVLEGSATLPEGAEVRVEVTQDPSQIDFFQISKLAVPTGIPDLARNVDHYLYGHPKVDDAQP